LFASAKKNHLGLSPNCIPASISAKKNTENEPKADETKTRRTFIHRAFAFGEKLKKLALPLPWTGQSG